MKIPNNPRKPTETNPIKMRKLIVYPDFFTYKKKQYQYEDVSKLAFDWFALLSLNPVSLWDLKIEFNLSDISSRIKIKTYYNPLVNISTKRFKEFYAGYYFMAQKSFNSRYHNYIDEFSKKGFFKWDDYLFFKDRVTDEKNWEAILNDGKKYLQKHKNGILLCSKEKINPTIGSKIFPNYSKAVGSFFDDTDIDILEKLLDEFYNLKL